MRRGYIHLYGLNLVFHRVGKGPPVLLLAEEASRWPEVAGLEPPFTLYLLDLPGGPIMTPEEVAQYVAAFVVMLNLGSPPALLRGAGLALKVESLKPSLAAIGGTQGFGLEASWHCLLFQPPVGEVRPALDLAYDVGGKVNGAFLFRYLYPVAEGLKAGVGLGVSIPGFDFGNTRFYFRADAEYDLKAALGSPIFLGGDFGLLGNTLAAQLKLGYRF